MLALPAGNPTQWLCSYRQCHHIAVGTLNMQWTFFDFDDWPFCDQHIDELTSMAWRRRIDGQAPAGVWPEWWDTT